MRREIDYFFTLVSPFAYLGHDAFLALAERHGASVRYRPIDLAAVLEATGGVPLARRSPARQAYRLVELQRWRERRGLALNLRPAHFPTDPTLANTTALALVEAGHDPRGFMGRAYRAVWVDDANIADESVIGAMLESLGIDPISTIVAARSPAVAARYADDTAAAISAGAFGAPVFMLDGEPFWGQDRIDMLDEALSSGRAPYRAD